LEGSWFQASLGRKICETLISTEKQWPWCYAPVIPAVRDYVNRRIIGWPGQKARPCLQNNHRKGEEVMA
jgi:hypothetical protein